MKGPLFSVLAVTAIVIAVVLILVIGAVPRGTNPNSQDAEIDLVINQFELTACDDLRVIGAMFVDRGEAYERVTGFSASAPCIADLQQAAALRGFAEDAAGQLTLEPLPGMREVLVIYPEETSGRTAFEWERIKE